MKERTQSSRFEIRDNRRLCFYAATFETPTRVLDFMPGQRDKSYFTEVIHPGAFKRSLNTDAEVIANIDHDANRTFAKKSDGSLMIQEDPKGLFASAWLPDDELGESIIEGINKEIITGCSFRFDIVKARWVGDSCELQDVNLADVCVTGSPCYPNTEVHLRTKNQLQEQIARLAFLKFKFGRINKFKGAI